MNISQTNVLEKDDALQNVEPAFFQPNESMRSISEDIETVTRAKKRPRGNENDVNDLIENDISLDESDSESQNIIDLNDIAWEKAVGKRMDCDDLIYTKDEKRKLRFGPVTRAKSFSKARMTKRNHGRTNRGEGKFKPG